MNKIEAFKTFVVEESVVVAFISGSHETETMNLETVLNLPGYTSISNVHQRKGKGGRPAIVVNTDKFNIKNLTNTEINIPWGVEVTWELLSPKIVAQNIIIPKYV